MEILTFYSWNIAMWILKSEKDQHWESVTSISRICDYFIECQISKQWQTVAFKTLITRDIDTNIRQHNNLSIKIVPLTISTYLNISIFTFLRVCALLCVHLISINCHCRSRTVEVVYQLVIFYVYKYVR